jgi:hypothetical protein
MKENLIDGWYSSCRRDEEGAYRIVSEDIKSAVGDPDVDVSPCKCVAGYRLNAAQAGD